ncbi:MAG: signal peptide peptidase SppA [Planctomycetota bacterium]
MTIRLPVLLAAWLCAAPAFLPAQNDKPAPNDKAAKAEAPAAADAKDADADDDGKAKKPRVPFLKPKGAYADLAEMGFDPTALLLGGGGGAPKAFFPFVEAVRGLAKVPEAEVVLDLSGGAQFNLPQLRELERALQAVRAAGKKVTCYVESADLATYQLAAQCDQILLADMGALDLRSPAMNVMHLKDALDLLGVQVEVTRVGAFKGAVEPYMLPTMSDHLRSHYEAMLRTMNDDVVRGIATGRKLTPDAVRALQAQRLWSAKDALQQGLVDALVPWSGAERALAVVRGNDDFELKDATAKKKAQNRDLMAMFSNMLRAKKEEAIEDPMVVVLHLAGQIVDGDATSGMASGPSVKKIDELAANEHVKGVVVRVNSPGGSATASEAIRQALIRLAAKKPVVFSMGELAASGGYWITAIGRPILAEAGTITGSIGVFGMRFQLGALMRRIGVHSEIVRLDDGPLMDAMDRPWSDAARGRMQAFVDDIYARFLAVVATSRKKTVEQVDAIAGGRVWSGQQAVDNGLVDALGGVDDAVAMVRKEASLGDDVEVTHQPEPKNFADSLFGSMFDAAVASGVDAVALRAVLARHGHLAELWGALHEALAGNGAAKVYALMPPGLRVR